MFQGWGFGTGKLSQDRMSKRSRNQELQVYGFLAKQPRANITKECET
jgi:hypothetical protein